MPPMLPELQKEKGYMRESAEIIKDALSKDTKPPSREEYDKALATIEEATKEMSKALIAGNNDAFMAAREKHITAVTITTRYKVNNE